MVDKKNKDKTTVDKKVETTPTVSSNASSAGASAENKAQQSAEKAAEQSAEQKTAAAQSEINKLEAELKASMENDAKKAQAEKQPAAKPASPRSHDTKAQRQKSSFSWLAFFAFILSLLSIAGAAYVYWLFDQTKQSVTEQQRHTADIAKQSLLESKNTLVDVQNTLSTLQRNQQSNNTFVMDTQRQLQSLNSRMKELGQSQPNTWLAAESLYLVNLAERRLLIENDVNTAIQLLVDANLRLDAMNDTSVFYLRTAISEDLAMLSNLAKPATDDAYLALSGLVSQLETLPLAHIYVPDPAKAEPKPEVSNDASDWKDNLATSVKRFMGNFITVTRRETAVEPELPPKQRWYVRANIRQQLLIAQQATLDTNNARFVDAVSHAEKWLTQYFDTSKPSVVATINTLSELKRTNVSIEIPSGLGSQALLNKFVIEQIQLQQSVPNDEIDASTAEPKQEGGTND